MKKLFLVMNPCSGKKRANKVLAEIIDVFNRADYEVTAYMTAARGDATRAAAERAADFDRIVCIGGDGTLNEVIAGLHEVGQQTPIGYIPAGSTNDFANSLGLPKDLLDAARLAATGEPRKLDIGSFNGRCFSYVASFGAFTRTSYATPQGMKNALGHVAYLLAGAKELTSIRSTHMRFVLADGTSFEDDYIFGAISNSTSVAGLLTLSPDLVDLNDGLFELLLIRKPHSLLELSDCVLALTTQEYHTPMLTMVSTGRVEIDCPSELDWTLDGEYAAGQAHCVVENLHDAIRVIVRPI